MVWWGGCGVGVVPGSVWCGVVWSAGKYSGTGTQRAPVVGSHLWGAVRETERERVSESQDRTRTEISTH